MNTTTAAARHLRLDGTPTTADDPLRGVWYGSGDCHYWTDDWNALGRTLGHVPCCPACQRVGFQNTFADFVNPPPKERCGVPHMTSWLGATGKPGGTDVEA